MSDDLIEVTFEIPESDNEFWVNTCALLEEHLGGAHFQDKLSRFGDEVDRVLEEILDDEDFGPEAFNLVEWSVEAGRVEMSFEFPDPEFCHSLEKLFLLCGVNNLKVDGSV